MSPADNPAHPDNAGPVEREASLLVETLRGLTGGGAARSDCTCGGSASPGAGSDAHGAAPGSDAHGTSCGADAHGTSAGASSRPLTCGICPVCRGIEALSAVPPEVLDRVGDVAEALLVLVRELATSARSRHADPDAGDAEQARATDHPADAPQAHGDRGE